MKLTPRIYKACYFNIKLNFFLSTKSFILSKTPNGIESVSRPQARAFPVEKRSSIYISTHHFPIKIKMKVWIKPTTLSLPFPLTHFILSETPNGIESVSRPQARAFPVGKRSSKYIFTHHFPFKIKMKV